MKKLIYLFAVVVMFIIASNSYGQDISPERKVYNLKNLEIELFKLPYEIDYIKETLFVEVVDNRSQLAPHYPDVSVLPRNEEARNNAFYSWIDLYPLSILIILSI